MSKNKYLFPLIIMASLFFVFGFITTMNNSAIDFLKNAFGLDEATKQFSNTFFYGAYVLSIPVGFLLTKIGYRNGVLLGLALIAMGFFASIWGMGIGYGGFLATVSIFAIGVTILQVVAAPYVTALGPAKTAASRLTLTNALNSLATVIAPIFVSILLVTPKLGEGETLAATEVQKIVSGPFLGVGIFALVILAIIFFLKLPEIKDGENEGAQKSTVKYKSSAFKYPHVWLGSLAIFVYMGIEIGISSLFPDFVKHVNADPEKFGVGKLAFYWGGLMVGRVIGIFVLQKFKPGLILIICSVGGAALLATAMFIGGDIGVWLFLATGLFHSIMWPVIYSLAIEDLGPHAKVASGIVATSVIGGAILLPIMGLVQRATDSVIIALCFLFVYYLYQIFFAAKGSKIRTK